MRPKTPPAVASLIKEREVLCVYAIIKTGGKQYKVQEGDIIYVEKLGLEADETVQFTEVLAVSDGKKLTVGKPFVKNYVVNGKVVKNGKGKKITVIKFKAKKNYRRTQGHRQPYTKVQIEKISK